MIANDGAGVLTSRHTWFVSMGEARREEVPGPNDKHQRFDGSVGWRKYFDGSFAQGGTPLQGDLVDFPVVSKMGVHFHPVDQFQLFLPSAGAWYQRHAISSPFLHYADAFTSYGPFGTTEEVLQFFVLRARGDGATFYMPDDRGQLIRRPGRNYTIEVGQYQNGLPNPGVAVVRALLEPEADHLAVYLLSAGPGAEIEGPAAVGSGGQFYCVMEGNAAFDGTTYGPWSLGWCDIDSQPPVLRAPKNDAGFHVLVAQLPSDTTAKSISDTGALSS